MVNLSTLRSVYLVGIKGVGMTALARYVQAQGIRVTGSDTAQHFFTQEILERDRIPYIEGFAATNVPENAELVVRSTAYEPTHVEVAEALRRGIPVWTYPEAIAAVFNGARSDDGSRPRHIGIAVCGTHGKTTTTALLGHILAEAGKNPTVLVGSDVPQFGGSARIGSPDLVILEADEYQDKLQYYAPFGVILTSIEYDHPDFFPTFDAYVGVFQRFVARIPRIGFLVACADDPVVVRVAATARCDVVWYGRNALQTDYTAVHAFCNASGKEGDEGVRAHQRTTGDIHLQLPGDHNIQNALGAIAAAAQLGVPPDIARATVALFRGTKRRFEVIGEVGGVTVIDDYGHHPTEIRVTLAAACQRYPGRRILCAFHAHTFTRTIALKDDFARAFVDANATYVMDIFGSARERQGGISAADLATAITAHSPAQASGGAAETVDALVRDAQRGDVIICMGAGENDAVARGVLERLRASAL